MPFYDYECLECGKTIEVLQKFSDPKKETHKEIDANSKCNGPVIRLVGQANGLIFKGSGFYSTDYRKK